MAGRAKIKILLINHLQAKKGILKKQGPKMVICGKKIRYFVLHLVLFQFHKS